MRGQSKALPARLLFGMQPSRNPTLPRSVVENKSKDGAWIQLLFRPGMWFRRCPADLALGRSKPWLGEVLSATFWLSSTKAVLVLCTSVMMASSGKGD